MNWKSAIMMPAIALLAISAGTAEEKLPELAALLHLPFDGDAAAHAAGASVTGGEALRYAEGTLGQAADFRAGGCVEYRELPPLNLRSGTIEMWVKAAHGGKDPEDHYYLQFLSEDGSSGIEFKFYHVEMAPQVRLWSGSQEYRRYGWGFSQDVWQHLVVAWNDGDPELSGLHLYRDGRKTGYPATYRLLEAAPTLLRVGCKSREEGQHAKALVDEVCVYNRCLSDTQVLALYENGALPLQERISRLRECIARDDAVKHERLDLLFHHRKIAVLHGRNQSLIHWPDSAFAALQLPAPAAKIHEDDLAQVDLSQYDVLFVGGGGGLNLTDATREALLRYVREGGGYVGICGGAISAHKAGLLEAVSYRFRVQGTAWITLRQHPLTEGYDPLVPLPCSHASGPLWVAKGDPNEAVILFDDIGESIEPDSPPLPTFAHTFAKHYGKGRVVAFSGHPEGLAGTRRLILNAVLWTAHIIGVESDDRKPRADGGR